MFTASSRTQHVEQIAGPSQQATHQQQQSTSLEQSQGNRQAFAFARLALLNAAGAGLHQLQVARRRQASIDGSGVSPIYVGSADRATEEATGSGSKTNRTKPVGTGKGTADTPALKRSGSSILKSYSGPLDQHQQQQPQQQPNRVKFVDDVHKTAQLSGVHLPPPLPTPGSMQVQQQLGGSHQPSQGPQLPQSQGLKEPAAPAAAAYDALTSHLHILSAPALLQQSVQQQHQHQQGNSGSSACWSQPMWQPSATAALHLRPPLYNSTPGTVSVPAAVSTSSAAALPSRSSSAPVSGMFLSPSQQLQPQQPEAHTSNGPAVSSSHMPGGISSSLGKSNAFLAALANGIPFQTIKALAASQAALGLGTPYATAAAPAEAGAADAHPATTAAAATSSAIQHDVPLLSSSSHMLPPHADGKQSGLLTMPQATTSTKHTDTRKSNVAATSAHGTSGSMPAPTCGVALSHAEALQQLAKLGLPQQELLKLAASKLSCSNGTTPTCAGHAAMLDGPASKQAVHSAESATKHTSENGSNAPRMQQPPKQQQQQQH
eukprot:jgi/Chrzof1/14885/Cz09g19160.t1